MKHWTYAGRGEPSDIDRQTIALLFQGLTYSEVAKERRRSTRTIETTVRRLMAETRTHTARALVYKALTLGWISPPPRYIEGDSAVLFDSRNRTE